MAKIIKINGTQLTNKPNILSEVNEEGFVFVDDEGEEEIITFETIKEYFINKRTKIEIKEMSRVEIE